MFTGIKQKSNLLLNKNLKLLMCACVYLKKNHPDILNISLNADCYFLHTVRGQISLSNTMIK